MSTKIVYSSESDEQTMTWGSAVLVDDLYETRRVLPDVRLMKPGVWNPKTLEVTGGGGAAVEGSVSAGRVGSSASADSVA